MTAGAITTKLTIMCIICGVAIITGRKLVLHVRHRLFMAIVTMDIPVFAVQFKFRLLVMVKSPYTPVIGIVARLTLPSHPALMHIVFFVTAHAIPVQILVLVIDMTLLAGQGRMQAEQGEFGDVVIEHHLFLPVVCIMTILAVFALLPFMHVVLAMTRIALHAGLVFIGVTCVAVFAGGFFVLAEQLEFCR